MGRIPTLDEAIVSLTDVELEAFVRQYAADAEMYRVGEGPGRPPRPRHAAFHQAMCVRLAEEQDRRKVQLHAIEADLDPDAHTAGALVDQWRDEDGIAD